MGLYSWGCNSFGQLALQNDPVNNDDITDIDDNNRSVPTQVQFDISQKTWKVSSGWRHTIIITNELVAYSCGDNSFGQLGRSSKLSIAPVTKLENVKITDASCGETHTLLLSDKGKVFAFGQNNMGQLGVGSEHLSYSSPILVEKISISYEVTAISCGQEHSLALTSDGQIFTWGNNKYGQLGIGTKSEKMITPQLVTSLKGCPIQHLCAGAYHSFVLSISGKLFAWGKNSFGQLGIGSTDDSLYPTRVKFPLQENENIRYITCGEEHSAALTSGGKVLTFGCGSSGQLGHNSYKDEHTPRVVFDLLGHGIISLVCGRKHTLCSCSFTGDVYSFGLNVKGQLGNGIYQKVNSPTKVKRHWKSFTKADYRNISSGQKSDYFESQLNDFMDEVQEKMNHNQHDSPEILQQICAGGLSSYLLTSPIENPRLPMLHNLPKTNNLCILTQKRVDKIAGILQRKALENTVQAHEHHLVRAFSSQACLNGSFLDLKKHESTCKSEHGLHLMGIHVSMERIWPTANHLIKNCLKSSLLPSLHSNPADIECLRVYVILPEVLILMQPEEMVSFSVPFAEAINALQQAASKVLVSWWNNFPPTFLERIVKCFKSTILELFPKNRSHSFHSQNIVSNLDLCLKVLKLVYEVSENQGEGLNYSSFYIPGLMDKIDLRKDFINWIEDPDRFSFCNYPFVFEIKEKALIMELDADLQMKFMVGRAQLFNLTGLATGQLDVPQNPFLILHIRRDHLVQDTLNNILAQDMVDFKKPLKIRFADEDAEDAGGVKKEFFLLLMKDLLDPQYGMFDSFNNTGNMWFKPGSFEGPEMFMLIGVICGLAIYNSIIVDLPFPVPLYKKLLNRKTVLDDYRDIDPDVYRGLQKMMDYYGDDFNDIYDMNFQVIETMFGENKIVDLKENGGNVSVTQQNKEEYVKCFIDYKFNQSVSREFEAFKDGFLRVCGGKFLHFLHPQELMELVVGSQDYDFVELEKVTEYKGEYYRRHPVIVNFWEVFHGLSLDLKKKFLAFLTGTSKVSVLGIKHMKFIIQPVAGGEEGTHLPVAHTCFNLLDLPRYPNLETMRRKIHQAIENSEGFGLV